MPICTAQQLKDITYDIFISAHCPENIAHKIA